jgi:hypothetical protein
VEGGTLTGASWTTTDPVAATQYDTSATAITGGIFRQAGYNAKGSTSSVIPNNQITGHANSVFTIVAKGIGANASVVATMNWREII